MYAQVTLVAQPGGNKVRNVNRGGVELQPKLFMFPQA